MAIVETGNYSVTPARMQELLDAELFLSCLEAGGVDSWEWYDEAVEEFNRIKGEDE